MKIYSEAEVKAALQDLVKGSPADLDTDNTGQMIIYTGLFNWKDGTVRDEEDPSYEE